MGNNSSMPNSSSGTKNASKCNSCSQKGLYFSFGQNTKEVIQIEIKPRLQVPVNLTESNLDKLKAWWEQRLVNWNFIETKNIKVVPDYDKKTLNIFYDKPQNLKNEIDDIEINNEMISDPDDDGNYPIYVKNRNIVSIDRKISNGGKDTLVLSKLLNEKTLNVPNESNTFGISKLKSNKNNKTNMTDKLYAVINGKQKRIYVDSKGKYYKQNSQKKYLKKGIRTYKQSLKNVKTSPKVKRKDYYLNKKIKSPLRKPVKDSKKNKVGTRLSARAIFNEMGKSAIGKPFSILQKDGTRQIKYLRLRNNGSPYFANKFGNVHNNHELIQLNIPHNKNWLRGPYPGDDMTGLKYSWPNHGYDIAPAGVAQPFRTSLLPRIKPVTRRGNNRNSMNVPHMHYGKMCFGA
jgi:hypothetical protein